MTRSIAISQARVQLSKTLNFRNWSGTHGEIHIPKSGRSQNNSPARASKRGFRSSVSYSGHLNTLLSLHPRTAADTWEKKSLSLLAAGSQEQLIFVEILQRPYLRIIHPVIANPNCLGCHPDLQAGKVCGGEALTMPLGSLIQEQDKSLQRSAVTLGGLWITGLFCLLFSTRALIRLSDKQGQLLHKIHAQEEHLKLITRSTHLGTWDWDIAKDRVIFNKHWADILGSPLSEIPNNAAAWTERLHPDDRPRVRQILLEHHSGKSPTYMSEHRLRHQTGRWVWVLEVGQVLSRDDRGNPLRAAGILLDLSKQKDAEGALRSAKEEAEFANRSKSIFLANMSHELRTPLNGIMGYTQIFLQDQRLDQGQQEGIKVIHESAEHLLQIITDILDLSKIEAGRLDLVEEEYRLPDLLQQVANIIQVRCLEKGLTFSFKAGPNLPHVVLGDALRLRQVLLNLLANSVKFTPKGRISLKASLLPSPSPKQNDECGVLISVEDSGPGIPQEHQERIFEPFQQTGDRLLYSEGTGLGLSISRKLVAMMGGSLSLISPLPNRPPSPHGPGSCFTLSLHFEKVESPTPPDAELDYIVGYMVNGQISTAKKILLVDDNTINRIVWREILSHVGFQVIEAQDGSEVLEACQTFEPNIVLMDLMMSPMDGYQATSILRSHQAFSKLPIIAVSALADLKGEMNSSCRAAGFDDYIAKPLIKEALLLKIASLLNIELIFQNRSPRQVRDAFLVPKVAQIQAILKYVLVGDLESINMEMAKIEKEGMHYHPFVEHLKKMSDNFQFDALEEALEGFIEDARNA